MTWHPPAGRTRAAATAGPGLITRLLIAQAVILSLALAAAVGVSAAVAPAVLRTRLTAAGVQGSAAAAAERAFNAANWVDLVIATAVIALASILGGALTARRLNRSVQRLAAAADCLGDGELNVLVPLFRSAPELNRIAAALDGMAARLQATELTRRRLLADLAHELRTPLATLDGYLEGLHDGIVAPTLETLQLLRGQTRRMTRLVADIATVSAAEEGRLLGPVGPVDVAGLVDDAVAAAFGLAARAWPQKQLSITVLMDRSHLVVEGDRDRLEQILVNLTNNALRHASPMGTVTVNVGMAQERAGHPCVRITVTDDGDGIAAEHLPYVFERFWRADPARSRSTGGAGVGLTIARAIATAHGGRLTATSPGLGCGATFTLVLPVASLAPSITAAGGSP